MYEGLKQIITDWREGKQIRVLTLGHDRQTTQSLLYDSAFQVMSQYVQDGKKPESIEEVFELIKTTTAGQHLTVHEKETAAGFAWSVLRNGWMRAIAGHPEHQYQVISRETAA